MRYNMVMHKIGRFLVTLDFKVNSVGFIYWVYAIYLNRKKYWQINSMMNFYKDIAEEFNTTPTRVERAMRTCREKADNKINSYFNYHKKLNNNTVLQLITYEFLFDDHIPRID